MIMRDTRFLVFAPVADWTMHLASNEDERGSIPLRSACVVSRKSNITKV